MLSKRLMLGAPALLLVLGFAQGARGQGIPTPESVLGHPVGADFRLATYDDAVRYLRALEAASDMIRLESVGYTSEGREWWIAVVSSPDNLADLDRWKDISRRLARGGPGPDEARQLAREGRAIVQIDGGMHSTESANAQHTLQLAYDLVAGAGDPAVSRVLDEVVLLLWPTLNPDGLQMASEWYRSNVGTPFEIAPLPWLYQKYVGHDNNRDGYMMNTVEARTLNRVWREWEPQVIHVHHQSSPFPTRIWLPPFAEPVAPRAPPLASRTINELGMAMARALEESGQPGATHMDAFDAWYPGYSDYLPVFQNIAAYWTETALYRYATPRFYTVSDFPAGRREGRAEPLYSSPWPGGWWRIGDAVSYMLTASKAVLDYASTHRERLLFNRYQGARDQIHAYSERGPAAYAVPRRQRDPVAAAELLRRLAFNGISVHRLGAEATLSGVSFERGDWVIDMAQPYAALVHQLFEAQVYPDLRTPDGAPAQPYDFAGWTLPAQMGLRVVEVRSPLPESVAAALEPVTGSVVTWREAGAGTGGGPANRVAPIDRFAPGRYAAFTRTPSADVDGLEAGSPVRRDVTSWDTPRDQGFDEDPVAAGIVPLPGEVSGSGPALWLDPAQNNSFRALNRAFDEGASVALRAGSGTDGLVYAVQGLGAGLERELVASLALQARRGAGGGQSVRRPRLGLLRPWRASMDEGWTRWLLERFGFPLVSVADDDVRAGALADRYDVLVIPSEPAEALRNGWMPGTIPDRFAGGLGPEGLRSLDAFVRNGGVLIALNGSSDLVIEALGLPVRNVVADLPREEFFVGGSLLEVTTDPEHPVMAGMSRRAAVVFDRSPVFEVDDGAGARVFARYAANGNPLISGYVLGERHLHGRAAALEVPHGAGRVYLIGFRPQWRGQPFGTFRVLFNALLAPASEPDGDPDRER